MQTIHLEEGKTTMQKGCFTYEQYISGMTLEEIGRELGLPPARLMNGGWVVFALKLPLFDQFDCGGWAEFSTDNFMKKSALTKNEVWNRMAYEKTYKNRRLPVSILDAKAGHMQQMATRKLVKLVPVLMHNDTYKYPSGGKAPQIIVYQELPCQVLKFLQAGSGERFRMW